MNLLIIMIEVQIVHFYYPSIITLCNLGDCKILNSNNLISAKAMRIINLIWNGNHNQQNRSVLKPGMLYFYVQ